MKKPKKSLDEESVKKPSALPLLWVALVAMIYIALHFGPQVVEKMDEQNSCQTMLDYSATYRSTTNTICEYSCLNSIVRTELRLGSYKLKDAPKSYELIPSSTKKECTALCTELDKISGFDFAKYMKEIGCLDETD